MGGNTPNRKRIFADVVTIDAWHEPFGGAAKVDLHADVVFGEARIGGEAEAPIRFRLRLKRAEVVVVIPETEPVVVDKRSVSRDTPKLKTRLKKITKKTLTANARVGIGAHASPHEAGAAASAAANAGASSHSDHVLEVTGEANFMSVTQSQTSDGHYRWKIVPLGAEHLEGRPWDSAKSPRLKLIDKRKDRTKGIPPTVRVEVHCKREDLSIEEIVVKDSTLWEKATRQLGFDNRRAAAESYIRDRLVEEGLQVGDMSQFYSTVSLASVTAEPSE